MGDFMGAVGAFVLSVLANLASDLLHDWIVERRQRQKGVGKHSRR